MNFVRQNMMYIIGIVVGLFVIVVLFQSWNPVLGAREKRVSKIVTVEGVLLK
jgi:hypothetical protein